MNYFDAAILSIIEGITEFLPISSTGHLILATKLLGIPQTEFTKTFEIAIQSGAIASVVVLYGKSLLGNQESLKKVLVAFVPTGILGFIFYKVVKAYLLGNTFVTLMTLLLGGISIILIEKFFKNRPKVGDISSLSYKKAFLIGLAQSISMIPGVSRSAATIIGAMFAGMNRTAAVEFSFILAIPTMLAATGYDLLKSLPNIQNSEFNILIFGFVVSFIVALVVIKWFLGFVRKYSLTSFGWYRIALSILFLLLVK